MTPATQRLLQHWRRHPFQTVRPFFCQVEAVETAIWLAEVARRDRRYERFRKHLQGANEQANPELFRVALKMATGSGKTTVMAMLIAWQTVNAVRTPGSSLYSRGFLVVTPGITIKDRLRVLQPNDPDSYYRGRELVPADMLPDIDRAKIVITNYHAFKPRETLEISKTGRSLLQGRDAPPDTIENDGQMLHRVANDLLGFKGVVVLNDEAHHCYREKPDSDEEISADEREEAKSNNEAARLWIAGLEAVKRKLGITALYDLSATPFFLRGSGYREGTLFPWTVSDFSLMDAIECGIVKLPRIPVSDNLPGADVPIYRNLWEHIRKDMPKMGRAKGGKGNPLALPNELQTALYALYGHYEKTFEQWERAGIEVPPVFIVVCNNTSTSELVYEWISGFERDGEDEQNRFIDGHLKLFRNYDEHGARLARPNTLLIDSEQVDSGEALDPAFRAAVGPEIDVFRREKMQREGAGDRGRGDLGRRAAARGDEHGRPQGAARRDGALRRLRLHADRGMGHQHRHPHPRRARLRHAASVRAGGGARAAAAILRDERRRAVRRGIRRHHGHPVRLRRPARRRQAEAAEAHHARAGDEGARGAGDHLPPCRRLPRGAAGRAGGGRVHRRTRAWS